MVPLSPSAPPPELIALAPAAPREHPISCSPRPSAQVAEREDLLARELEIEDHHEGEQRRERREQTEDQERSQPELADHDHAREGSRIVRDERLFFFLNVRAPTSLPLFPLPVPLRI